MERIFSKPFIAALEGNADVLTRPNSITDVASACSNLLVDAAVVILETQTVTIVPLSTLIFSLYLLMTRPLSPPIHPDRLPDP